MTEIYTRYFYKYDDTQKKCWVVSQDFEEKDDEGGYSFNPVSEVRIEEELPLISSTSFKWVFNHYGATLTIDYLTTDYIIDIVLRDVKEELPTIRNWTDFTARWNRDFVVWNSDKQEYEVIDPYPVKTFRLYTDKFDKTRPIYFWFDQWLHMVWKDKDEKRGWYWYRWDYEGAWSINEFLYQTLSPHIKKEDGQIVAIPGERGGGVHVWLEDGGYDTNHKYYEVYDTDEEVEKNKNLYDFYYEDWDSWNRVYGKPALVITFFPTQVGEDNDKNKKERLTATKWLKNIWKVFGEKGTPIVIRSYEGFIFKQLYTNHNELYRRISAITKLPTEISNTETASGGAGRYLVYFNCPFLGKSIAEGGKGVKNEIKWNPEIDKDRKYIIYNL